MPSQRFTRTVSNPPTRARQRPTHLVRDREPVGPVLDVDALLVVLEEALLLAVRADRGEARERLGEVAVQRRAEDRVEPFELARTRAVEHRGPEVQRGDAEDGDQEPREDDGDEDDGAEDVGERREEHAQ